MILRTAVEACIQGVFVSLRNWRLEAANASSREWVRHPGDVAKLQLSIRTLSDLFNCYANASYREWRVWALKCTSDGHDIRSETKQE